MGGLNQLSEDPLVHSRTRPWTRVVPEPGGAHPYTDYPKRHAENSRSQRRIETADRPRARMLSSAR